MTTVFRSPVSVQPVQQIADDLHNRPFYHSRQCRKAQVLLITLTMVPFYASESACPLQDPENEADK